MSKLLDEAVVDAGDGTWTVVCPITDRSCGPRDSETPFVSTGWPTKKVARARLDEHIAEHRGEGVTSSLEEFRVKHNLQVDPQGVVTVKDL